jgi:hypothetical protein
MWVNDEEGERLYQLAYDHVEIREERASEVQCMLNVKSNNLLPSSTINSHKPFGNTPIKNAYGGTAANHRYPSLAPGAE